MPVSEPDFLHNPEALALYKSAIERANAGTSAPQRPDLIESPSDDSRELWRPKLTDDDHEPVVEATIPMADTSGDTIVNDQESVAIPKGMTPRDWVKLKTEELRERSTLNPTVLAEESLKNAARAVVLLTGPRS